VFDLSTQDAHPILTLLCRESALPYARLSNCYFWTMIKFHTLLTQPIIVVRIGSTWNFDRWKWAALSNTMRVEVFKPNDLFTSLCDFRCKKDVALSLKSPGNRIQFEFNEEIIADIQKLQKKT
jgi:hypothetical protein